jgi:membrane protease YdiL (CAAX protease family)
MATPSIAGAPWLTRPRRIRFLDVLFFLLLLPALIFAVGGVARLTQWQPPIAEALANPEEHILLLLGLLAASFGLVALAVVIAMARHGLTAPWLLGFRRSNWRWWVGGAIGIVAISAFLGEFVLPLLEQHAQIDTRMSTSDLIRKLLHDGVTTQYAILVIGIWAPFVEELVFRGLLFGWLIGRFPGWFAVLVSAIAFGAAHVEPTHAAMAGVLGLWLGYLRLKGGSIWPPIVAHMVNNTVFVAAMYLLA